MIGCAITAASQILTKSEAIERARRAGMKAVLEVELEHGNIWEIDGLDKNGRAIQLEINARSGHVRRVDDD
jgi:uncharacterized membrane protein YkoI